MGCGDSMAMPQRPLQQRPAHNYNNNPASMFNQMGTAKRPKFLNPQQLTQSQKDTLWAIIQRNSLKEFAYYVENQRIPSNMEVGPGNTFWNFAHFCARWDAFECLEYMIKRVYAQNSTLLLSFMNQQSIQGYTAIHVAIEWGSINCFNLLLDSGGIDLSYTDKSNNDVFAKANLFKRAEMLQVLEQFKAANALMVLVQSQKVRGFKNFSQLVASGQVTQKQSYTLSPQRITQIIDTRNKLNRPPPPPPPIQNNPNTFQDYNNKMKQIQSQRNTSTQSSQQAQTINMQKLQEQRRFQQEQARVKQQQANDKKRMVEIQRQEEENRLRAEMEQQVNRERQFEQAELARIQAEEEVIKRNIQAMMSGPQQTNLSFGSNKMTCPQDIRPLYEAALSKGTKFTDQQFPPSLQSIGPTQKFKFGWQDCVWLRPQQMFPGGQFQVFDGISPDDVKQGTLAVCYYLALLSSIAQHEERVKKVFRFYDKALGFYAVQLYLEGKPVTVVVDDLFPCMKGTNEPLFAKPRGAEVWVMVFEKAWVKMFGSYLAAEYMSSSDMFQNLLPSPSRWFIMDVQKIDEFFDKFVDFDNKKYIMTTTSRSEEETQTPGLVAEHAYSLIGAYNINGVKLSKIRNPWGKTEYAGMYSQSSPLWTPQLQKAVGFQPGDDGVFYLNPTELHSLMPCVTVSYYRDSYEYSWLQITSKSDEDLYYVINIKNKAEIAFKLTQQNERFRKNMIYENCPIRFEIIKLGDNFDAKFISEGQPSCMYDRAANLYSTENIFENLDAGRYMIRLKVMYDRAQLVNTRGAMRKFIRGTDGKKPLQVREDKSVLSIYGPQRYVFNRITSEEAWKYLKNGYRNYLLESKTTSQRLRSVGQDLIPTVIAKDCKMRNQIIYYAQNLFPNNAINFKFQFSHEKFRNCSYAQNVNLDTESCEWTIQPGGWNLATLQIDCPYQQIATENGLQSTFKIVR